jgi:hypothetical protein
MRAEKLNTSSNVLALAERYLGTNPTKMRRLRCANFVGMIEKKVGRSGSGSNFARSYANYGKRSRSRSPATSPSWAAASAADMSAISSAGRQTAKPS